MPRPSCQRRGDGATCESRHGQRKPCAVADKHAVFDYVPFRPRGWPDRPGTLLCQSRLSQLADGRNGLAKVALGGQEWSGGLGNAESFCSFNLESVKLSIALAVRVKPGNGLVIPPPALLAFILIGMNHGEEKPVITVALTVTSQFH